MGTRRRKRAIDRTRKKKGGAWTTNQNKSVKRRQNLLRYTSNSKAKSNHALQAIRNYLEAAQQNNSDNDVTADEVIDIIRPDAKRQKGAFSDYIYHVKISWNGLVNAKVRNMMVHKKAINRLHHESDRAMLLANRAAARVQQAAHVASIGRLSNSSHARFASELETWNKSLDPVNKDDHPNMIQMKAEEIRRVYELKEQVLHQILGQMKRLDQIIPLYDFYEYQHPVDKKKEDIVKIIEQARNTILMKIPELRNVAYNKDHVIPDIMEDVYDLLVETLEEYIVEIEKVKSLSTLEILKIQLKIYSLKEEQMLLAQQHFKILREMSDAIRVQMSRRPRIDMTIYRRVLEQIKEIEQRIEIEQNRLQRR
jgi:hypothetical protein